MTEHMRKTALVVYLTTLSVAILFLFLSLSNVFSAEARRDVPEGTSSGQIIDLTANALFEEDAWEGKNFFADERSRANGLEKDYEIRYADGTAYFVYALKVPVAADYLYQDGRYSGLEFIESFSFDYLNERGYYGGDSYWEDYAYEISTAGHVNSVLDLISELNIDAAKKAELNTLNGNEGYYMLYLKFHDSDTATGYGAQIVGRIRFSTDAQILPDANTPEIYESESKGFVPDVYATNDGDYLFYVNGSSTSVSAGKYFRKFDGGADGAFYGEILGDYGIYKFSFDTSKGEDYTFASLALDVEIWGHFRLSISNGKIMPSPSAGAYAGRYSAPLYWDDIQCGYFGKSRSNYSLDISDWIYDDGSGTCIVYLRVADATDSDGGNGGQVGQIGMTAYYAYTGAPVIEGGDLSGYVGLPVDLSVITAKAGINDFDADIGFEAANAQGERVALSESGISFVPEAAGEYSVRAIAVDGNGNRAEESFKVTVIENTKTIEGVSVYKLPDSTSYEYGKPVDLTGGKLKIEFTDGSDYVISLLDCSVDKNVLTRLGDAEIELLFTYGDNRYQTNFTASCIDYVKSIAVTAVGGAVFYTGSIPDISRFTVSAFYAGGIAAGNTVDSYLIDSDDPLLRFGDIAYDDVGKHIATIYYGDVSVQFAVSLVEDSIVGVSIGNLPDKIVYKAGDLIDFTGGTIQIIYKSGRVAYLDMRDNAVYFIGYDKNTVGVQTIVIMYDHFSFDFEVTVG